MVVSCFLFYNYSTNPRPWFEKISSENCLIYVLLYDFWENLKRSCDMILWLWFGAFRKPIFSEKFMHASKISRLKQFCSLKEKLFFGTPWSYYDNELENFKIAFFGDESISILWSANLYTILSDLMIPLVKVLIFWPRKKF